MALLNSIFLASAGFSDKTTIIHFVAVGCCACQVLKSGLVCRKIGVSLLSILNLSPSLFKGSVGRFFLDNGHSFFRFSVLAGILPSRSDRNETSLDFRLHDDRFC